MSKTLTPEAAQTTAQLQAIHRKWRVTVGKAPGIPRVDTSAGLARRESRLGGLQDQDTATHTSPGQTQLPDGRNHQSHSGIVRCTQTTRLEE